MARLVGVDIPNNKRGEKLLLLMFMESDVAAPKKFFRKLVSIKI
jgi:hypothetical protein